MKKIFIIVSALVFFYGIVFYILPSIKRQTFTEKEAVAFVNNQKIKEVETENIPTVLHQKAPYPLYGAYFSSWAAGSPVFRKRMHDLIDTGVINAVVIDVKDSTGKIGFIPQSVELQAIGSGENRIADIDTFIQELHKKGVYVIGRIAVFQDNYLARKKPEWALLHTGTQKPWADKHNLAWLDPGSEEVWKYVLSVADESYARGFDEINFDYIRFPSDGATKKYTRQFVPEKLLPDVLKGFFEYVDTTANNKYPISFDIFGMTTTAQDDMGIGQLFEDIIPHGNYTMPMVYPSHYGPGLFGFTTPAEHPYEVVLEAMTSAKIRAEKIGVSPEKLRSWIQDFNLGASYDAQKVFAQMRATKDAGIPSWVLWNAGNIYTKEALLQFKQFIESDTGTHGNIE